MRTKKLTEMNMQMTRKEFRSIRFPIGRYQEGGNKCLWGSGT